MIQTANVCANFLLNDFVNLQLMHLLCNYQSFWCNQYYGITHCWFHYKGYVVYWVVLCKYLSIHKEIFYETASLCFVLYILPYTFCLLHILVQCWIYNFMCECSRLYILTFTVYLLCFIMVCNKSLFLEKSSTQFRFSPQTINFLLFFSQQKIRGPPLSS